MRWSWLVVLAACTRPPPTQCPVCASRTEAVTAAPAPALPPDDPQKLERACMIVEQGARLAVAEQQRLAHDLVRAARIVERLEKQQHGAMQQPLEASIAGIYGTKPKWAFLVGPTKIAASSTKPPAVDALWALAKDGASLQQLDGEWTLFTSSIIPAPTTSGLMVLWRAASFVAELEKLANASITITDKVESDVRGIGCQPLDDKHMVVPIGASYVVVEAR